MKRERLQGGRGADSAARADAGALEGRLYRPAVFLVVGLALALRLIGLGKGIWLDEYHSLTVAFADPLLDKLRSIDHPPLYFVLLRLWGLLSREEAFLRLLSVAFGVATVVGIIAWTRSFSRSASLLAGLWAACAPIFLRYSHEIRGYALLVLATTVSFWLAQRAAARSVAGHPPARLDSVGLSAALTVAVLTHMVGIFVVTSVLLYLVLSLGGVSRGNLRRAALLGLVPGSVFLCLYIFFVSSGKDPQSWWMPELSGPWLATVGRSVFGWNELYLLDRFTGWSFAPHVLFILVFSAFLAVGKWRSWLPTALGGALYLFQVLAVSVLYLPILIDKTVFPFLVPFVALVSDRISALSNRVWRIAAVTAVVSLSAVWAFYWVKIGARKPFEPWKDVAGLLDAHWEPGDVAVFYPSFIAGVSTYYCEKVEPESRFPAPPDAKRLEEYLARVLREAKGPLQVHLVLRAGYSGRVRRSASQLLAVLEELAGGEGTETRFGGIRVIRFRLNPAEGFESNGRRSTAVVGKTAEETPAFTGRGSEIFENSFESGELSAWSPEG